MRLKICLDMCCLNRPFDDQSQARIHLESEAVLWILRQVEAGVYGLIGSEILELENSRNPNLHRQNRVAEILQLASGRIKLTASLRRRAGLLVSLGFKPMDALHLVSAEQAEADAFTSCDDKLLRAAVRNRNTLQVRVVDPIHFVRSV